MNFYLYSPGFAPDEGKYYELYRCKKHLCDFLGIKEDDILFAALEATTPGNVKCGSYSVWYTNQPCEECAE